MLTSGNSPSAGIVEFSYANKSNRSFLYHKMASTYAEERRTAVGVLVIRVQALYGLHRATRKAIGIRWVTVLPVGPYLIDHLQSGAAAQCVVLATQYCKPSV
jgi:hypothetical protein